MILRTNQLSHEQLVALEQLHAACKAYDGNAMPFYSHLLRQPRPLPASLLYYYQQQLIGFISPFFFYEDACEIALMVAPAYRRKGIARQLISQLLPLVRAEYIPNLIFSMGQGVNDNWLTACGGCYKNSEYEMKRDNKEMLLEESYPLQIRQAKQEDITQLSSIHSACFPTTEGEMAPRIHALLQDPNYTVMIGYWHNVAIAKAHLFWQKNGARLSDIAVLPSAQKQGFGRKLLTHCINYAIAIQKPSLILDVETTNANALQLYSKLGFTISNACDFWKITLDKVAKLTIPERGT